MTRLSITSVLLFVACSCPAQAPSIQWQKSLAGSAYDLGRVAEPTPDGGFIVIGTSGSNDGNVTGNHGDYDYWVVKLNDTGGIQWQRSYGGTGSDEALDIHATSDGGYIAAGYTWSVDGDVTVNHGNADYWIIKLNDTGGIQWQKSYGGTNIDYALSVKQCPGGYIIAGESGSTDGDVTGNHGNYDCWIVRINDTGAILWQKSLGGSAEDDALSIINLSDGGFVFSAQSASNDGDVIGNHGLFDYWIVRLNDTGGIIWQKSLGGSGLDNQPWTIWQTADGGFITGGFSQSHDGDVTGNHGGKDYWVTKLSATGALVWQHSYGGSLDDWGRGMTPTADGGFVICGNSSSNDGDVLGNHGNSDYWILKGNDTGGIVWQRPYGGSGSDNAFGIRTTSDGGYIVAGQSFSNDFEVSGNHGNYDYWIVKLSCGISAGSIIGDTTVCVGATTVLTDTTGGILWGVSNSRASVSGGTVIGLLPGADTVTVTKTTACGTATAAHRIVIYPCPDAVNQSPQPGNSLIFPNPTYSDIYFANGPVDHVTVCNIMGQQILSARNTGHLSLAGYAPGIYFIRLFAAGGELLGQEKLVKMP